MTKLRKKRQQNNCNYFQSLRNNSFSISPAKLHIPKLILLMSLFAYRIVDSNLVVFFVIKEVSIDEAIITNGWKRKFEETFIDRQSLMSLN